ncbi:MAG: hypothetical protein HKN36_14185 [Hellea sp.]|nr:hypothetical protein [Hellea sp.]
MTTQFNGRTFKNQATHTFGETFEGGFVRREKALGSLVVRRDARRERRNNRAI